MVFALLSTRNALSALWRLAGLARAVDLGPIQAKAATVDWSGVEQERGQGRNHKSDDLLSANSYNVMSSICTFNDKEHHNEKARHTTQREMVLYSP